MALKAGRRGIAKKLVDAFGNYKGGSSPTGEYYTKSESDLRYQLKLNNSEAVVELGTGVTIHSGAGNKVTRLGNIVVLTLAVDVTSIAAWSGVIGTIPTGFRPPYRSRFICSDNSQSIIIDIKDNGEIVSGVNLSNKEVWISVVYVVE